MSSSGRWRWNVWVPILLLVVALVPRVVAFGALTNPDEINWLDRSVSFYDALDRHDWAATLEAFHPGIVPAWGFGALLYGRYGLPQLRAWQEAGALPMADLAHTALFFPIFVSVLTVLAAYGLVRRLAGREAALYGALLLAVEPYYLTFTHAIHLDLTQASFMFLAALSWLNYLHGRRRWPFLVGSGIAGGLALLTRTGALYLVPFSLLAAGVYFLADNLAGRRFHLRSGWRRWLGRTALAWLAWLAVLGLVVFALWPALWVEPAAALGKLATGVLRSVENPHAAPAFFLGRIITTDPGVLYYVLILLFRLRPLTLMFFMLNPLLLGLAWRRLSARQRATWSLGLAYPLFYFVMMALAPHKLERYMVPLIPPLAFLAGASLAVAIPWSVRWFGRRLARSLSAGVRLASTGAAILVLAIPWLRLAPYYAAYFDPLVGGGREATRLFIVGGGEGLDLAAAYLNEKKDAQDMAVVSFYAHLFRYYFDGQSKPHRWGSWAGLPVAAQYVVITQGQAQRGIDRPTLNAFLPRQPEYTVRINGIDYAWIYRVPRQELSAPPPIEHPMDANFEHRVHLVGYDAEQGSDSLHVTLYWQLIVAMQQELWVSLRLVDSAGQVIVEQNDPPWSGDAAVLSWPNGLALRDEHSLPLPAGAPAGEYSLVVSLGQREEDGQERLLKLEGEGGSEVILGPIPVE